MKDVHFGLCSGEKKQKGGLVLSIKGVVGVFGVSYTIKTVLGDLNVEGNPAN